MEVSYNYYATAQSATSTTSTVFQQKLSLLIPASTIPTGSYRLAWSYEWQCQSNSIDFIGRVQQNNTVDLMYHQEEPKDASPNQWMTSSGFCYLNLTGGLEYFFDLDYCVSTSGNVSAGIRKATLEFWRAS